MSDPREQTWIIWKWDIEESRFYAIGDLTGPSDGETALYQARMSLPNFRNLAVSPATQPRNLQ